MISAKLIEKFLQQEQLTDSYRLDIDGYLMSLAHQLDEMLNARDATLPPLIVGINGAQGTGKSTLARFLQLTLESQPRKPGASLTGTIAKTTDEALGKTVANLSIDDFYLSRSKRHELAHAVHPLLQTRGVPGTHNVAQAMATLDALLAADANSETRIPRFDKATDDPMPASAWTVVSGKVDLILLEGWFVGATPEPADNLSTPINPLEKNRDKDGSWRRYVNAQLAGAYQDLFQRLDLLVMLQAPDFAQILQWRNQQERSLAQQHPDTLNQVMSSQQIGEFIQYFQRLTAHCLATLPPRADLVLRLDEQHRITSSRVKAAD